MISSMTGFAAKDSQLDDGSVLLEIKSVNSRYLDLQFKLDDTFKSLEFRLRELIKTKLQRGKVECKMQFIPTQQLSQESTVNQAAIQQLKTLEESVKKTFPEGQALTIHEVLQWPDVLNKSGVNVEAVHDIGLKIVEGGLDDLNISRRAEGDKLNQIIIERLAEVEKIVVEVRPKMPVVIKAYEKKLTQKLQEAMQTVDDARISQEIAIFAQRADVDEELSRLDAHIAEVHKIMQKKGPVGKRLDFMMQEMNREANTLGAKSLSIETTQAAMALKVLIEQMREQIQNIE